MQSLSSDSSREDVAKAMLLSLASIEHLRKISPDKMTSSNSTDKLKQISSNKKEFHLTLYEGFHCISENSSSGVETNTTFANISHCGGNRRQMFCGTTTPEAKETPGPNPTANSPQNSNPLELPLGVALGVGASLITATVFYVRRLNRKQNSNLLEQLNPQTATAASAIAPAAGASSRGELVISLGGREV